MKSVYRDHKTSSHCLTAWDEKRLRSCSSTGYHLRMNKLSTAGFCAPVGSLACLAWKDFSKSNSHLCLCQQSATRGARGAVDKPQIKRWSTGFSFFGQLTYGFFLRASLKTFKTVVYSALEGQRGGLLPTGPKCRHNIPLSVALPRHPLCAMMTRPICCVSGLWTRYILTC